MNNKASEQIRIGIVGLGNVAEHQIRALRELRAKFLLAAVCDYNPVRAKIAPRVPFFKDVESLIEHGNIDTLLISVPNREHFHVASQVLIAGYDVLIEKPATETVEQFEILCALADGKQVILQTAFHAAFAPDLLWFLEYYESMKSELGPITALLCEFYDPYIIEGDLAAAALGLGGSWIDSGINALSVISRLLEKYAVADLRLTSLPQFKCRELQGSGSIIFPVNGNLSGMGHIDTNWTLNVNSKSTLLFFGMSGCRIVLNHSTQQVELFDRRGRGQIIFDASDRMPRLTAHYLGVFDDFHEHVIRRRDNRKLSLSLLKKLYEKDEM